MHILAIICGVVAVLIGIAIWIVMDATHVSFVEYAHGMRPLEVATANYICIRLAIAAGVVVVLGAVFAAVAWFAGDL
jgi:hypothetical protein